MNDQDCTRFLQWALPQLRMRWKGFRKVRGQVCKRIDRRMLELGLTDAAVYRLFLQQHIDEWTILDSLCRVTISRFYRDREVFRSLEREVLAQLSKTAIARGERELRCWSIGCASGEEPYTLAILWDLVIFRNFPSLDIAIVATDADRNMIERANEGCYGQGSLLGLPPDWKASAFIRERDRFCIRAEEREKVGFLEQDIRTAEPGGLFHLILCRNLVFTYFDTDLQREVLARLRDKLHPGGALVVGIHESPPSGIGRLLPWPGCPGIYRKET